MTLPLYWHSDCGFSSCRRSRVWLRLAGQARAVVAAMLQAMLTSHRVKVWGVMGKLLVLRLWVLQQVQLRQLVSGLVFQCFQGFALHAPQLVEDHAESGVALEMLSMAVKKVPIQRV